MYSIRTLEAEKISENQLCVSAKEGSSKLTEPFLVPVQGLDRDLVFGNKLEELESLPQTIPIPVSRQRRVFVAEIQRPVS